MERIDCEKCRNGHFYEGDKLRCRLRKCQPDYEDMQEARQALCSAFPKSFINEKDEFIAEERSNQYFILSDCEYPEDIDCKVLEWLSRAASKGAPFNQEWRNRKFRKFMLDGINNFLDTSFSEEEMEEIYTYLENACNHRKTKQFVESGFDMKVLKEEVT
jgi:hypothetical protein